MADLTFVVGDDAPSIFGTITNTDGTPFSLSGCSVRFLMRSLVDGRATVDASAVIVDATAGSVRYDWAAGDLAEPGNYEMRWRITFGDGSVTHTEPENTISVEAA